MKQLRWVWILGIAAAVLLGVFIVVDQHTKKQENIASSGGPKQLFSFDGNDIRRMTIDNEEGSFDFEWDAAELTWKLVSEDKFEINAYAVAAIADYFSHLNSLKTVVPNCQDTSPYGFDSPVTIKVYTEKTGDDSPYVLYVGSNTPTYDAYYAMVGGSSDVYTINYSSGSVFCAAKNTLKNMYIFDTTASMISYIKVENGGKTLMEMSRGTDHLWSLIQPAGFDLLNSNMDELCDDLTRITVTSYVEENPENLAKYGLDKPKAKFILQGTINSAPRHREVWVGAPVSEHAEETELYGYFVEEKQVFTIKSTELAFTERSVTSYISPYCQIIDAEHVQQIDIDMGDVYDLNETLKINIPNEKYSLGDTNITAMQNETVTSKFTSFYGAIFSLRFTDIDIETKPDLKKEPSIRITFLMDDGKKTEFAFIEKEANLYYLVTDGKYTGKLVRLKTFSDVGGIIETYEALMTEIKAAKS